MNILYNPEMLKQKANEIENYKEEIIQVLNSIDNEINSLKLQWQGMAKDGFVMNYENLKPVIQSYLAFIDNSAKGIVTSALQAQEADRECASAIRRW